MPLEGTIHTDQPRWPTNSTWGSFRHSCSIEKDAAVALSGGIVGGALALPNYGNIPLHVWKSIDATNRAATQDHGGEKIGVCALCCQKHTATMCGGQFPKHSMPAVRKANTPLESERFVAGGVKVEEELALSNAQAVAHMLPHIVE